LSCAEILNGAPNIEYIEALENGGISLADASVSLIYSFAVIQHVTDDAFQSFLSEWKRVLCPGGAVICHIVVNGLGWKSEREWRDDRTLSGRLKSLFGLHCFTRTPEQVTSRILAAGFDLTEMTVIKNLEVHFEDDIVGQHLLTFRK
jgi:SAM-dependent methyltransferase